MKSYPALEKSLREFYRWYSPDKLGEWEWVTTMITEWEDEDSMWEALARKYGPWPCNQQHYPERTIERSVSPYHRDNKIVPLGREHNIVLRTTRLLETDRISPVYSSPEIQKCLQFNSEGTYQPTKYTSVANAESVVELTQLEDFLLFGHQQSIDDDINKHSQFSGIQPFDSLSPSRVEGPPLDKVMVHAIKERDIEVERLKKLIIQRERELLQFREASDRQRQIIEKAKEELQQVKDFKPRLPSELLVTSVLVNGCDGENITQHLNTTTEQPSEGDEQKEESGATYFTLIDLPFRGKKRHDLPAGVLAALVSSVVVCVFPTVERPEPVTQPGFALVVSATGALAREGEDLKSPEVTRFPHNTVVHVDEVRDRRGLISFPQTGWISLVSGAGKVLVVPNPPPKVTHGTILATRGAVVKQKLDPKSAEVGRVDRHATIDIIEIEGKRAQIIAPLKGWISLKNSAGQDLVEIVDDSMQVANRPGPAKVVVEVSVKLDKPKETKKKKNDKRRKKASPEVIILAVGDTVQVEEITDSKVRISAPHAGWCPLKVSGRNAFSQEKEAEEVPEQESDNNDDEEDFLESSDENEEETVVPSSSPVFDSEYKVEATEGGVDIIQIKYCLDATLWTGIDQGKIMLADEFHPKIFDRAFVLPISYESRHENSKNHFSITPSHPTNLYLLWPGGQRRPGWLGVKFTKLQRYEVRCTPTEDCEDPFHYFDVFKHDGPLKKNFVFPATGVNKNSPGSQLPFAVVVAQHIERPPNNKRVLKKSWPTLGKKVAVTSRNWHTGQIIGRVTSQKDLQFGRWKVAMDRNLFENPRPIHFYSTSEMRDFAGQIKELDPISVKSTPSWEGLEGIKLKTDLASSNKSSLVNIFFGIKQGLNKKIIGWGQVAIAPIDLVQGPTTKTVNLTGVPEDKTHAPRPLSVKEAMIKSAKPPPPVLVKEAGPAVIVNKSGAYARKTAKTSSDVIEILKYNTKVNITKIVGRRAEIDNPVEGWISTSDSKGKIVVSQIQEAVESFEEILNKRLDARRLAISFVDGAQEKLSERKKRDREKQKITRCITDPPATPFSVVITISPSGDIQQLPVISDATIDIADSIDQLEQQMKDVPAAIAEDIAQLQKQLPAPADDPLL